VSTKYGIVNHDQVIQWSMSISSKSIFLQRYHSERKVPKDKKKKKKKKKDEEQDNPADVQDNNVLT
jgi:hypothetical protein